MKKIFATIALIAIGSMAYTYAQNNVIVEETEGREGPNRMWHEVAFDCFPTGYGCLEITVTG